MMERRLGLAGLVLIGVAGCGGAGAPTSSAMAPVDPTLRANASGDANRPETAARLAPGKNVPLGPLKLLSEKSPYLKPASGKADAESTAKLAKLTSEPLSLGENFAYYVTGPDAARIPTGEEGATAPLPADAKPNSDGSYWVIEAETKRLYTITSVTKEAEKPVKATSLPSLDLVHPTVESYAPLSLAVRADQAATEIRHALRITVKGVGTEGGFSSGQLVRLRSNFSEKGVPPLTKAVYRALKRFGAVLEGGDSAPVLTALGDPRWTKEDRSAINVLHLSDFEVVANPVKKLVPRGDKG